MTNTPLSNFYDERHDTKVGDNYDISERYSYNTLARNNTEVRDDEVFVRDNDSDIDYGSSVRNDNNAHYETSIGDTNDIREETNIRNDSETRDDISIHDDNDTHHETSIHDETKDRDEIPFRDESTQEPEETSHHDNFDEVSFRENDTKQRDEISVRDDTNNYETSYETSVREHNNTLNETFVRDNYDSYDISARNDNNMTYDTSVNDETKVPDEKVSDDTTVPYHDDAFVNNDTNVRHNTLEEDTNVHDDKHFDAEVSNEAQNSNSLDENLSPGTRLRQVREQNNLSVKQIADQLYLDIRVIEALESDNHNILPPTIFVRGYLRNYAKLLEISPESIMESFDQIQQQASPSFTPQVRRNKKQSMGRDFWPTIVTGLVIVISIILVALWPFFPNTSSEHQQSIQEYKENADSLWTSELPPTVFTPSEETEAVFTNQFEKTQPNTSKKLEVTTSTMDKPNTLVENSQPTSAMANTTEEPVASVEDKSIRVHFTQRAWVKITDNSGKKIYEKIGDVGKVLPLEGTAPFYLKVGNIDGIDIEYKGETKNITTYPKRRGWKNLFIVGAD